MRIKKIFITALILLCTVSLLTACSKPEEKIDYTGYTDEEFLVGVNRWQNQNLPGIIWTINEDGKGQLTSDNERKVYDFTWTYADEVLSFDIADWPYIDSEQSFAITTDKENVSFSSVSLLYESEAVFVPYDENAFPSYEDNKPEELCGIWAKENTSDPDAVFVRGWYLMPKDERSGYGNYNQETKQLFVTTYFDDWNKVDDNTIILVAENGNESQYTYKIDGDIMTLTSQSGDQGIFERLDLAAVEVQK